jgi:Tectonin domain
MMRDWLLERFGQRPRWRARAHRPRRTRSLRTEMESLEGRTLLAATSAISWTIGNVTHSALYAIGQNDNVEVSVDGGSFTNLGGDFKQISAGLNGLNHPEVYGIGLNGAVWFDQGSGWVDLGGDFKQISATVNGSLFAIGTDDSVYVNPGDTPNDFVLLGGGGTFKEISAGADEFGNLYVFAIGYDNAVYLNYDQVADGSWIDLGGYAKQISATINHVVYVIGPDNAVYENNDGDGWVDLGGYAKQISAGVTTLPGSPSVFAIGLNDSLYDNSGSGWVNQGGYVTDLAGPAAGNFGISLPANLVYVVGKGHGGYVHEGSSFYSLGGYIQTPSGATTDDTNSWDPATRDSSAISWASGSATHTALYIIGPYDNVEVSVDGGSFTNLGGYAKQISAGFDNSTNKPEVYAIGSDNAVWVNEGSGWVSLGGYAKQISAADDNTVYAIGTDDAVWINMRSGWVSLGGYAQQISAGEDSAGGDPLVFAIGKYNDVWVNRFYDPAGWVDLGGYAKQISAAENHGEQVVYAIGGNNAVYENNAAGGGWVDLGGYAEQISAEATSDLGSSVVFAISVANDLWSNDGSGWVSLGDNVAEVSAPAAGNSGVNLPSELVYVIELGHSAFLHKGASFSPILGGTVE